MSTRRESPKAGKVDEELVAFIKNMVGDRPVAYHPLVARAVGSVSAAIFLSQLLYWMPRSSRDGWIYKKRDEIEEETALTRYEQEGARKVLVAKGVMEEKRKGVPPVMHFRIDLERLAALLLEYKPRTPQGQPPQPTPDSPTDQPEQEEQRPPINWGKTHQLNGGNSTNQSAAKPPNITETTAENTTENVVVVARDALKEFGLSEGVATHLVETYPEPHILAKLDLVRWLVENNSPLVSKNPAGYLRRAIEQDYAPPPQYQTPAQRHAAAAAKEAADTAEQEERRQAEREYAEDLAQREQELREMYPPHPIPGTDRTTTEVWDETLGLLRAQVVGLAFVMFLQNSVLTQYDAGHATIVTPSRFNAERLATHYDPLIRQTLGHVLGQPVSCTYVPRAEALATAEDLPQSDEPSVTSAGHNERGRTAGVGGVA